MEDKEEEMKLIYKAIEEFVKAQECDQFFYAAVFHEGQMLRYVGNYNEALEKFSKCAIKMPNKTVYYARGLVYQKMGNH